MRLVFLMIGIAGWASAGEPQSAPGPLALSLKQAVAMATSVEGNSQIRLAMAALREMTDKVAETRSALLPNLEGAVTYQDLTRNLAAMGFSLKTPVPIPGFQIPAFVGPFQTVDFRASATQSLFDFSSIRRYQSSKAGVSAAESDVEGTAERVAADVARAYLAAVRADADVETAKASVNLSEALLQQAENLKSAGTGTGIDVTRAKVQLADDRQRLLEAENRRRSAYLRLLRVVGLRLDLQLELTDSLRFVPLDAITLEQATAEALQHRPDYVAQRRREETARLSASAVKMERLPSVAAFGDYGAIGSGASALLPTRTVGIAVRLPIFDGGRRDARRSESASQYLAERVRSRDLKEQIELDVRLALDELHSAEEQVKVAQGGLALANAEMLQARRRLDAGVAVSLEVTDAQARLARAQDNQTAALYKYNVAKIDLAQAMGKVRSLVQ
jgi:outer membrane protein